MKTIRPVLIALCGVSTLGLAACGEGWEAVPFRGSVPYVEERTAGPGVAYVRAHMMPEKTIVIEEKVVTPAPVIKDAEPIFEKKMQKK